MARKLVGIADAKDLTTEEDVAKFTRNLEAVMLKNQFDNDPNMILTCVTSVENYDPEDARRQINSHMAEVMAGLKQAQAKKKLESDN